MRQLRILFRDALIEDPPAGGKEYDPGFSTFYLRFLNRLRQAMRIGQHGFDRTENRFALHHHPLATPVGQVIRCPMLPGSPIADVVMPKIHESAFLRLAKNTLGKRAFGNGRKKAEDIDSQGLAC
jgi:hypothetical protein